MSWLLEGLRKYKDNRGMMANLRCGLVDSKKHRAWPVLNRLGIAINDDISAFVAELFATHPEETSTGNIGTTCNHIERQRERQRSADAKLTPTERRFQHLLAAEPGEELHGRILRIVLMAKAHAIPVNYEQLEIDLRRFMKNRDQIRTDWAAAFWTPGIQTETEEAI